jgi:hypothetical protein
MENNQEYEAEIRAIAAQVDAAAAGIWAKHGVAKNKVLDAVAKAVDECNTVEVE